MSDLMRKQSMFQPLPSTSLQPGEIPPSALAVEIAATAERCFPACLSILILSSGNDCCVHKLRTCKTMPQQCYLPPNLPRQNQRYQLYQAYQTLKRPEPTDRMNSAMVVLAAADLGGTPNYKVRWISWTRASTTTGEFSMQKHLPVMMMKRSRRTARRTSYVERACESASRSASLRMYLIFRRGCCEGTPALHKAGT